MITATVEGNAWELTKMVPPYWWRSLQGMWKLTASHDWHSSPQTWLHFAVWSQWLGSRQKACWFYAQSMFTRFLPLHRVFWCIIHVCWICITVHTSTLFFVRAVTTSENYQPALACLDAERWRSAVQICSGQFSPLALSICFQRIQIGPEDGPP